MGMSLDLRLVLGVGSLYRKMAQPLVRARRQRDPFARAIERIGVGPGLVHVPPDLATGGVAREGLCVVGSVAPERDVGTAQGHRFRAGRTRHLSSYTTG